MCMWCFGGLAFDTNEALQIEGLAGYFDVIRPRLDDFCVRTPCAHVCYHLNIQRWLHRRISALLAAGCETLEMFGSWLDACDKMYYWFIVLVLGCGLCCVHMLSVCQGSCLWPVCTCCPSARSALYDWWWGESFWSLKHLLDGAHNGLSLTRTGVTPLLKAMLHLRIILIHRLSTHGHQRRTILHQLCFFCPLLLHVLRYWRARPCQYTMSRH